VVLALTVDDQAALVRLRSTAEARGAITEAMRRSMDAQKMLAVGLDGRHVCKRPGFAVVFSIEEIEQPRRPKPVVHRHLSISLPTGDRPPRQFVEAVGNVLGFSSRLELAPSPEAGWVITHAWEEVR